MPKGSSLGSNTKLLWPPCRRCSSSSWLSAFRKPWYRSSAMRVLVSQ